MIRHLGPVVLVLLLGACASAPERPASTATAEARALLELGRTLPGEYLASRNRRQREAGEPPLWITVETLPSSQIGQAGFTLSQRQGDGPPRHFLVAMTAASDGRANGAFAPLDESGQPRHRCDMRFSLGNNGFVGETDPETCRFGPDQATGLLKEIAFNGSRLVIADRLVDIETGDALAADQIHRFVRTRSYSGWAGRREGDSWRLAREFSLEAGSPMVPLDAAGMALGFQVDLEIVELHDGDEVMLRLNVVDSETGAVIGQAWADPEAESLGLALPDNQVGLRLLPD